MSLNFTLAALCASSTATRLNLDNRPTPDIAFALGNLAANLERVRLVLGHPMMIDSGFRCLALNLAVGGAQKSAHMDGDAADFVCPGFGTPLEISKAIIASDVKFDQLIQEGTWVHVSFAPAMRQQTLTANFGIGAVKYTAGV
jgi:hypothetical protein